MVATSNSNTLVQISHLEIVFFEKYILKNLRIEKKNEKSKINSFNIKYVMQFFSDKLCCEISVLRIFWTPPKIHFLFCQIKLVSVLILNRVND